MTTDKSKSYPKALRTVLPAVEHRTSKYLNNGIERDHQQGCPLGQGRVRPMRCFKHRESAANFCQGHTLIRNLIRGFSYLTVAVPRHLRLAHAWTMLTAIL